VIVLIGVVFYLGVEFSTLAEIGTGLVRDPTCGDLGRDCSDELVPLVEECGDLFVELFPDEL